MGFGPKLFQFHKKETQYTLRLIPLGGYCMMLSEDDEENENDENSFEKKSIWARMAVVLAGPAMNFVIAFLFSMVIIHFCGSDPAIIGAVYNKDNIEKYQLLSKIGTSQKMINHAIKAQIILYFCLPLSLALIHSYVGIKTAKILISTLGQINITKAAAQSLIIVIVIYIGYMIATYLGSKSMLKEK